MDADSWMFITLNRRKLFNSALYLEVLRALAWDVAGKDTHEIRLSYQ